MIVDLAEVISEMHGEMDEEIGRAYAPLSDRSRVDSRELCRVELSERLIELRDRPSDLSNEVVARHAARREFRIAIAHVRAAAENRSDKVAQVSRNV